MVEDAHHFFITICAAGVCGGMEIIMNDENNKNDEISQNDEINQNDEIGQNDEISQDENSYDLENNTIEAKVVISDAKPKKEHKVLKRFTKIIAAAMVFGLVAGASYQGYNYVIYNKNSGNAIGKNIGETENYSQSSDNNGLDSSQNTLEDVVAVETGTSKGNITSDVSTVVDNVMPAIVAINSVMTDVSGDMFGGQTNRDVEGSGSGIIIGQNDSEILIVTNNHVVENAKTVEIVFADETTAMATIKGTAPDSDLAVVSVDLDELEKGFIDNIKIATLGDSNTTKLGEMAIAIGNALGYGQSVTVGYVSALNREVTIEGLTMNLLQTDAAINPGNSGGALLNTSGEVIGINSVKFIDASVESIGYAIPISDAIPIINDLMNRTTLKESEIAYLGIAGKDVTDEYSQGFNMPIGIYVGQILEGSAAEKAGIKAKDVIVSINDIAVKTMADLQEVLSYTKAASTGTVTVKSLVDGKYVEKALDVTFDARPKSE